MLLIKFVLGFATTLFSMIGIGLYGVMLMLNMLPDVGQPWETYRWLSLLAMIIVWSMWVTDRTFGRR